MSRTKAHEAQVMISLRVGTQAQNARIIERVLEDAGYETWICIEMVGGVDFRSEIVDTIDHIDVMILMIDTEWATSGECEAEFNLAYRKHLTSRSTPRKPTFLPVVFPNLDWNAHKHIRLLMASTNAIVASQQKDMQEIAELLLSSIRNLGVEPRKAQVQSSIPSSAGGEGPVKKEKEVRNLQKALQYWTQEDVVYFLEEKGYNNLVPKFKENKIDGVDLLHASDDELKEALGVNSFFIRKFFGELKTEYSLDLLQGEWSCQGEMTFGHDASAYETNTFGVVIDNYGLAASGVTFSRKEGSKKSKQIDIKTFSTSVWQGRYDTESNFHIVCKMSCNIVIEFLGQLELRTPKLGVLTASLVEKDASSTKKYGKAIFTFNRRVGRDRKVRVELPPLPTSLSSTLQKGSVHPIHLKGEGMAELKSHHFNWRWFSRTVKDEVEKMRIVTIEPSPTEDQGEVGEQNVIPLDLYGPDEFYEGTERFQFGWSEKERGEEKFKVLTFVDWTEKQKSANKGEVYPWAFAGPPDFSGLTFFHFNWRWLKDVNGAPIRVVTLEDLAIE